MMKSPKYPQSLLLVALALMALASPDGMAATMSASPDPPARIGEDISNIPELPQGVTTNSDKWWPEPPGKFGEPHMTMGQTFTTGNGAVLLKAVTFRVRTATQPAKTYTIRVGTVSGSTFTAIASETATQAISTADDDYWTWTFDTPVLLSPNTLYGVDVGLNSSTSGWQTGIPYVYFTTSDTFPGGTRFRSGSAGYGIGNDSISQTSGDRIFHFALERPLGETFELVATSPADDETEVLATRNLVLTFSQNIAPGSGNLTIRNLSDANDITVPVDDPRLTYDENVLTIDANGLLDWSKDYAIRIDAGAIAGDGGTFFAGIDDDTTWNFSTAAGDPLLAAIAELKDHINGVIPLNAAQIEAHKLTIDNLRNRFPESAGTITAVFDLIETYDSVKGPLWVARGQFANRNTQPVDLDWTIYHVMQYIMDEIYTAPVLAAHESLLDGFIFGSHMDFPGPCPPPDDPAASHTVTMQGSFEDTFGRHTQQWTLPARKPTGTYLAPGTIATVTVPPEIVNMGFQVRVGAHSWDLSNRPPVRRLDRATRLYPVHDTTLKVASPYGGGIYIEVPFGADAGLIEVTVTGAVRAPYFSAKSFHQTTPEAWLVERAHLAPWADFQSDKFMMQVPTKWIYAHPDPAKLMADWDATIDAMNDLMGFPRLRGKETMYCQVDLIMRASVHAPGYPAVNVTDNPNNERGGYHHNYLVRGPGNNYHSANIELHEQGHAYFFPKFGGESESTVNLPHVPAMHRMFGYSLDEAFRGSLGITNPNRTLDNTAVAWMCVFNFSPRNQPMAEAEKAYQLKGHTKFVDIARLFGWDGLGDYWRSFMEDTANGVSYTTNTDALLLRLSRHVGRDIRPLFHFWGTFPQNNTTLGADLAAEGILPSQEIRNLLLYYKTLVPADNHAFRSFAQGWWGRQPRITGYWEEREHARQWDTTGLYGAGDQQRSEETNPGEIYNENSANEIRDRVDEIVDLYFPGGTADPDPPQFISLVPANGASDVSTPSTLSMIFDEEIVVGSGFITIRNLTDGTEQQLSVTDGAQVAISSEFVTITPADSLAAGKSYAVLVDAGSILDLAGNPFGGIADDTIWVFSTALALGNRFDDWASGFPDLTNPDPTLDFDGGGLATALEWVLGGDPTNPSDDATIRPTIDTTSDPDNKLLFTFRRQMDAAEDENTTIIVEYGNDLNGWSPAKHQIDGVTFSVQATDDPRVERVTVAVPPALADGGKLFVRLNVIIATD